jgi:MFS family permease
LAGSGLPGNVRLFLAFRVLFNARFYYPVLAVFFTDLGLTLDQYAWLNVAWALSIVLFELPLGAVADRIGRRPLVVGAAFLMVVEMAVLAFAPTGRPTLLFVVFLVNRVLSGLAEAAASGADEALAYDTLVAEGRREDWPRVLALLQRLMSAGFMVSMLLGAAVYDPELVNRVLGTDLTQLQTARFPVYLTLALALGAWAVAVRMREPAAEAHDPEPEDLAGVLGAGRWIRRTRFVLALILLFLVFDSVARLFITLTSSYYRMIGIPAALFGVIGAAFGALGFVSPALAQLVLRRGRPWASFVVAFTFGLFGLFGIAASDGWWGTLFVMPLMVGWQLLGFFVSHYLNDATESRRRATVLSFKSLAGNVAYGAAGGLYALLYRLSDGTAGGGDAVLAKTLVWLPWAMLAMAVPLLGWARRIPRMRRDETVSGGGEK